MITESLFLIAAAAVGVIVFYIYFLTNLARRQMFREALTHVEFRGFWQKHPPK